MRAAFVALCLLSCSQGGAPTKVAYDSPNGRVEVLGLRRWTLMMLQDSIHRYVPGQQLHDAACVITLRDSLHFADASVHQLTWPQPGQQPRSYLTIKLIEPQQAERVQWDVRPRDEFTSLLPDYAPLIMPLTDSIGDVWPGRILHGLQFSDSAQLHRGLTGAPSGARSDAKRTLEFRMRRRTEGDRQRAMQVLKSDGFWANRMAAAVVLSNFTQHDSTWWTLARSLRDPHEGVRRAAASVIRTLPPRPVDWRGAGKDLRLLVGGTNLDAMREVFSVLARTGISPEMAAIILRDNGDWVLDFLASETPMLSDAAHGLLISLNAGRDLGRSREAWSAWIQSL